MALRWSLIVFYFHALINRIATIRFTLLTIVLAPQKPTAKMEVSIPTNPQVRRCVYGTLHLSKCEVGKPISDKYFNIFDNEIDVWSLVLGTDPGNPPAVRDETTKTGQFRSRPVLKCNTVTLCGPKPNPYLSTCGFHRVWTDP